MTVLHAGSFHGQDPQQVIQRQMLQSQASHPVMQRIPSQGSQGSQLQRVSSQGSQPQYFQQGEMANELVAYQPPHAQAILVGDTPVFNGPVYNLDSLDNLPDPIESHQHLEQIDVDPTDPFAPQHYRLVTTHILPPVVVYAPSQEAIAEDRRNQRRLKASQTWTKDGRIGELVLDPLAPDGIAVKLLLLEARAPFVIHEVDPLRKSSVTTANPHGKVPCWLDGDGSCIWEANAIMRYICEKHSFDEQFYFADDGPMKYRNDMALDWCHEHLSAHIRHVLDPEAHEHEDLSDIPGGRMALEKDYKVITDYFLRETPFIGGLEPNIADYTICLHLLMLYSTSHPPPDRVRQYLHNTAEHVENWNDVTLPIREFCMLRQKELREAEADMDRLQTEEERAQRAEMVLQLAREAAERRQLEEEEARWQWEEEERRREEDDMRRRQEQDERMRDEWERKRNAVEDRKKQTLQEKRAAEEEAARLEEERRRREEEEEQWQREYEERRAKLGPKRTKSSLSVASSVSMRPQLGVEIKMLDDADGRKDCIVVVERVIPGGPCDRAGLQREDIIDCWNGERLTSREQWADKVRHARIGQGVTLTIYRGAEKRDLAVTIAGTSKQMGSVRIVPSKNKVNENFRYDTKPPSFKGSTRQRTATSIPSSSVTASPHSMGTFGSPGGATATSLGGTMQYGGLPPHHGGGGSSRSSSVQVFE